MNIKLSDHFTYKKLFRFTIPSIVMMIFTSIYGVVDGLFVSNYAGKTPFTAINLIMPFLMILGTFGFMIGAGGSALIGRLLGEGKQKRAHGLFSMLILITAVSGVVLGLTGIVFLKPISVFLGAKGEILANCVLYGKIILPALPFFMLQNVFQSFMITAEKPQLGLAMTIAAGMTNIVLDALFVGVFNYGLIGAAVATAVSQAVGGIAPIAYFARKNDSLLKLTKPIFDAKSLLKTVTNGSSELMTNISMSVVSMVYNYQLLAFAGEDGVAAYGVLMYVNFIFVAVFIGYSIGTAPIISYNFGAQNDAELKGVFKKSLVILSVSGVSMMILAILLAYPLSAIFVGKYPELFKMTIRAFLISSPSFLIAGYNIYGSSFFTALNNGVVSATISFLRTLLFQIICVLALPIVFKLDGIWMSVVVAEILSLAVTAMFIITMKKRYRYM